MNGLIDLIISGAIIYGVSQMDKGVKCNAPTDALLVAVLYSVFAQILGFLGFFAFIVSLLLFPIGPMLVYFTISVISLFLADKVVPGFEISSFPQTALVCVVIGALRMAVSAVTGL